MPVEYLQQYHDKIARARPIELARHYAIGEAIWEAQQQCVTGTLSKAKRDAQLRKLYAEEKESVIEFATEDMFARFCAARKPLHDQYLHEQEHAEIYRTHGISYAFGFIKIVSHGEIGLIPWIRANWPKDMLTSQRLTITIESLENASEHSQGDLQDIAALKRILATMK